MSRFVILLAVLFQALSANAFVPANKAFVQPTRVFAGNDDRSSTVERGVSVDQDGKSNVWAIEPKMEVSSKSSDENTSSALIAGGGFAAFAVAAGFILTHLPDPNQF